MMKPVAHNDAAAAAKGAVSQGQGKAGQGSLFAKLMAMLGKTGKVDAAAMHVGKGKGVVTTGAKITVAQLKGELAAVEQKHVKPGGGKVLLDAHKHPFKKSQSKHGQEAQQVAAILSQGIQHQQKVVTGKSKETDKETAGNKGDKEKQSVAISKSVQDALGKQGAKGQSGSVKDAQLLQAAKASVGKENLAHTDVAHADEVAVKRGSSGTQQGPAQAADAGKGGHAKQVASQTAASQKGNGLKQVMSNGAGGAVSPDTKPDAAAISSQSTPMQPGQSRHAAQTAGSAAVSGGTDGHGLAASASGQSHDIAGAMKHGDAKAEQAKSKLQSAVAQGQEKAASHPSNAAAMKQAEAAAANRKEKAHSRFEVASAQGKKHKNTTTGQPQQAGKPESSVTAQVHAVSRNTPNAAASTTGSSAHPSSSDGSGAGSGSQQQVQDGSGNSNSAMPMSGSSAMTASSAIPRAYAGAPAGAHTGPWTAMMAMQETGFQASQGKTSIELTLTPAHLGKIKVQLKSDSQKNVQVHMIVDQAASRQVIQQHLPILRQTLEEHGLNLGQFSMDSQQQQQGDPDGGSQQQQEATASLLEGMGSASGNAPVMPATVASANSYGDSRLSIHI